MTTTATRPTYEGRPLPRPDEEVVDQGLGFDISTLLARRQVLEALGSISGFRAANGASADPFSTADGEVLDETAGPSGAGSHGHDLLARSGIVRADIRSSLGPAGGTAEGVPMELELTVIDLASGGAPLAGAAVYVWHCDRSGGYSMYSTGIATEDYLRGVQVADADGAVRFTSIVPACYAGRWPHIHFEVYRDEASVTDVANVVAGSPVALPQDMCHAVFAEPGYEQSVTNLTHVTLGTDNVYRDDGGASRPAMVSGDVDTGYHVSLAVGVAVTSTATGAGAPRSR
ncbi:intradiol ring-cleavage dioxygenase [Georgenia halophila]|uniref:Intradiol ring-cleavage dioxygenase n=1 Tax=Georgenia halophila TaxID=620889 RepID=A0ABP8LB77_9MICO